MARIRKKLGGWGMSSEACFLQDVAEVVDSLHKTPHYSEFGQSMVRVTDVKYGELDLSKTFRVDAEVFAEFSRRYKPSRGDIIITRVGTYGVFGKVLDTNFCLGQNTAAIIPKTIAPDYLYAVLNSDFVKSQIESSVVGSTQKTLSLKAIKALQIPRFRPSQELVIGSLGATFDDRITILRETNTTLEAIAQALFKSWFEDFDPVHAKMQGRTPEGMDEATAALFPESFEESELGAVPKGWHIGRLDDLLVLQRGFDLPAQDRTVGDFPIIAASGPSGTHHKSMVKGPGVVTGRSGVLGKVFFELEDFWPLNTTLWVKQFKAATPCYAYEVLRLLDFKSFNAGSAVPSLNRNHIHSLPYLLPARECVDTFEVIASQIHKRCRVNEKQIQTLVDIRVALLPRLISGQLRIPVTRTEMESV